jgi:hypothetical protein
MALASLTLERCFKRLNMHRSELAQRQCTNAGNDIVLDNSTMANRRLTRHPPLNIDRKPML